MNKPSILIYGASSAHLDEAYYDDARAVGRACAEAGAAVINGAGRAGMMGATIDGALEAGGETIGIIPRFMHERGWAHPGLSRVIVTETMHERKKTMADMATGVIALPGGIGTLDELMEIMTWRQLHLYEGNIVVLNTLSYYDGLIALLDDAERKGFMRPGQPHRLFTVTSDPAEAVAIALGDEKS